MDELRRSSWQPRSARRNHQMIVRTGVDLEVTLQRKPTHEELAQALGIDQDELAEMQRLSQPASYVSLDDDSAASNDDESLPLREILADPAAETPSHAFDTAEIRRALTLSISKLPPAEATVIVLHYLRNTPFQEIAKMMKVTPSRISQIHHRALGTLKKHLQKDEAEDLFN